MRQMTARRLRLYRRVVLIGTLTGIAYGVLIGLVFNLPVFIHGLVGAIDATLIAASVSATEIFVLPSRWGRPLQRAPFLVMFGVKWLVYAAIITTVVVGGPGAHLAGMPTSATPLQNPLVRLGLLFSAVATFAFLFVFELQQIVGGRNLRNVVLGRYHRPRVEERFFLFVDIVGSTSLAERLGPISVHRFLGGVFRVASEPISDHGGEIYQYVGDEMVVTWPAAEAREEARPIACFFAIATALEEASADFVREFGVAPRLRAALHAGPVIAGEIGETKRDIVFHGDVMNTAARLEGATRDLERGFLASADAVSRLARTERYALELLGPQTLRGRAAPIDVYAVEALAG